MDINHQWNDFGICVKCHAQLKCPGHYDNPDNKVEKEHARTCPAYGNYQPPYEECNCGVEEK
jgi:hypothetical protein